MARGKKTDNETIYKIMISMFTTNNLNETARLLKMPVNTVKGIYDRNIKKDEFVKLRTEKADEFVDNATRIINKASKLLERRLDTALKNQEELEALIEQVWDMDSSHFSERKKRAIVNRIGKMQLNSLSEITTAIGTMYDKRNLAEGKATTTTDINIKMDSQTEELSR